jgi:hypothetical protein
VRALEITRRATARTKGVIQGSFFVILLPPLACIPIFKHPQSSPFRLTKPPFERILPFPRRSGGMADARDSKSRTRKGVRVQVPPPASLFWGIRIPDPKSEYWNRASSFAKATERQESMARFARSRPPLARRTDLAGDLSSYKP